MHMVLPASPGYNEIRVDLAKEVLPSRLPAIEDPEGRIIARLLLQQRLLWVWPHHADVLGQEVNEYLQVRGQEMRENRFLKGNVIAEMDAR